MDLTTAFAASVPAMVLQYASQLNLFSLANAGGGIGVALLLWGRYPPPWHLLQAHKTDSPQRHEGTRVAQEQLLLRAAAGPSRSHARPAGSDTSGQLQTPSSGTPPAGMQRGPSRGRQPARTPKVPSSLPNLPARVGTGRVDTASREAAPVAVHAAGVATAGNRAVGTGADDPGPGPVLPPHSGSPAAGPPGSARGVAFSGALALEVAISAPRVQVDAGLLLPATAEPQRTGATASTSRGAHEASAARRRMSKPLLHPPATPEVGGHDSPAGHGNMTPPVLGAQADRQGQREAPASHSMRVTRSAAANTADRDAIPSGRVLRSASAKAKTAERDAEQSRHAPPQVVSSGTGEHRRDEPASRPMVDDAMPTLVQGGCSARTPMTRAAPKLQQQPGTDRPGPVTRRMTSAARTQSEAAACPAGEAGVPGDTGSNGGAGSDEAAARDTAAEPGAGALAASNVTPQAASAAPSQPSSGAVWPEEIYPIVEAKNLKNNTGVVVALDDKLKSAVVNATKSWTALVEVPEEEEVKHNEKGAKTKRKGAKTNKNPGRSLLVLLLLGNTRPTEKYRIGAARLAAIWLHEAGADAKCLEDIKANEILCENYVLVMGAHILTLLHSDLIANERGVDPIIEANRMMPEDMKALARQVHTDLEVVFRPQANDEDRSGSLCGPPRPTSAGEIQNWDYFGNLLKGIEAVAE